MVLHDLNTAAAYSDRLIAMLDGKILTQGQAEEVLTPDTMQQLFAVDCQITQHPTSGRPIVLNHHY